MRIQAYMRLVDKAVLKLIEDNERERMTQDQIAEVIELSPRTVRRVVKRLSDAGLLRSIGHNRNRTYEVIRHADAG